MTAAFVLALGACATPISPPGGPEDTTPPRLVDSAPAADAVNVRTDEVVLTFSELLDPASARQAVEVRPAQEVPPDVEVRGRRLTVRFREPLRDSTTYLITLGTALSDNHRVRLPAPIPFAFSTGPQLDAGRIAGLARNPRTGDAVSGLDVFAYAAGALLPDPRTTAPDYRTQTGADGRFELAYLRDAPFFVMLLDDANRNRRADPGERFAVPPRPRIRPTVPPSAPNASDGDETASIEELLEEGGLEEELREDVDVPRADSAAAEPRGLTLPDTATHSPAPPLRPLVPARADSLQPAGGAASLPAEPLPFWTTRLDTVPPEPRSARALTERRVAVRFDEAVLLADGARGWSVADSSSGSPVPVAAAYRLPDLPQQVVLWLAAPLAPARRHLVRLDGPAVSDSSGNAAAPFSLAFSPSTTADTLALRVDTFVPADDALVEGMLPAGARPGVRFSLPPPDTALVVTDTLGAPLSLAFATADGVTFQLREAPRVPVRLTAALPDTVQSRTFRPAPERERGALLGTVRLDSALAATPDLRIGVEAWPEGAAEPLRLLAEPDGRFTFSALPAGAYQLRFWLDEDGDGRWTGGRLAPYRAAEPLLLLAEPERVRARWDTEIADLVIESLR